MSTHRFILEPYKGVSTRHTYNPQNETFKIRKVYTR